MGKRFTENKIKTNFSTILLLIFVIVFVVSLVKIIQWAIYNNNNKKILEIVKSAVTTEEETDENGNKTTKYKVDFAKLKNQNSDTVAWIKVNGTNVEFPVVKATNNDFYLKHNFEKQYNEAGWIFADYRNLFDGTDKNIVIYGHNRRNGTMFSNLKNALQSEWYETKENRKITLITAEGSFKYEIFSIYQIEEEDYYLQTQFTEETFKEYIATVRKRSIKDFGIEVTTEDELLTLSTCANNNDYRVVIHAKKMGSI